MSGIFHDPRLDMPYIRTWDSREEHCAKVAMGRNDELRRVRISQERYKDLLIGALYELKNIVNDFDDVCETIGLTDEEREYFDI